MSNVRDRKFTALYGWIEGVIIKQMMLILLFFFLNDLFIFVQRTQGCVNFAYLFHTIFKLMSA